MPKSKLPLWVDTGGLHPKMTKPVRDMQVARSKYQGRRLLGEPPEEEENQHEPFFFAVVAYL